MNSHPVVVVGGGVVGLSCARYLRDANTDLLVCDRQELGRESSWAGAGILSPLYPTRYPSSMALLSSWTAAEYPKWAHDLRQETGIDTEYLRSGLIVLDPNRNGTESDSNLARAVGTAFRYLDPSDLSAVEPNLSFAREALLLPDVGQVRSPRLLAALEAPLRAAGQVRQGVEVTGFDVRASKLVGLRTNQGPIPTQKCIVTAGAWSGEILKKAGLELSVFPVRGQILLISAPKGHLRHILVQEYRYLVPRNDGGILVGSTLESVGFDKSTTQEARELLLETALNLVPSLADYPVVAHWAGLRPGSPDALPYIGEHPEIQGLFICTGHHRNGFATALATARMAVDMVLGRAPVLDPSPFRLDRPSAAAVRPGLRSDL